MGHDCRIAIIGGGPAGVMTAALLGSGFDVTIFDTKPLLSTLLPTGGGKCNLTYNEYDFKVFAQNYPRGEKFLYSIFSKYCMPETVEYFESIGVSTVAKDNGKIFPAEMSSKFVQEKLLAQIKHCHIQKEMVVSLKKNDKGFILKTNKSENLFDKVIVASGGHCNFSFIKELGVNVISPKPALTGLCTKEVFPQLSGLVLTDVLNKDTGLVDDVLFTHFGVSGPLIFKVSSIKARDEYPYELSFDVVGDKISNSQFLQEFLNANPHKEIKNILAEFIPRNFVLEFLRVLNINDKIPAHKITGKMRDVIFENLKNFKINILKPRPDGETVMCGGVDLNEINPKTLEHKFIKNLYFVGEVLDIDGFCGGFNLQNCWSGAFVISSELQVD